jgi:diguanylate cyclase
MANTQDNSYQITDRFSVKKALVQNFLLIFLPASLLLSGIFYAYSELSKDYELQTVMIREAAALKSASELTSLLLEQKLSDLLVLAEGETLRKYLHEENTKNRIHLAREFSLFARRKPKYAQIRLLDTEGNELIRVNNSNEVQTIVPQGNLQNKAPRYYFQRTNTLSQGDIYISPMDLNIENGEIIKPFQPTIRFATPVFDGYGVRRGIIVINYSPSELLDRIAEFFEPMLGNAVIVNSNGFWLMGVPDEKLWGFMFNRSETYADEHPEVWAAIEKSEHGTIGNEDGLFIFQRSYLLNRQRLGALENLSLPKDTSAQGIDAPHWILVSQISPAQLDELTSHRAAIATASYMTLFLVIGIISLSFAKTAVQKKLAYHRLQERAVTDELTGLANRREMKKIGEREFIRAQRFNRPLSVMMLDLDHFKSVNDTFGHHTGDQVLKHVATIFLSTIRLQDLVARFGGEEFVILMPETEIEGAILLAERIREKINKQPYHDKEDVVTINISIGVSTINEADSDYKQTLIRADKALYQAKERGRDRVEVMLVDEQ